MRVLLDESIPRRLAKHLTGVGADTVHDRGWSGLKNGELLRTAEPDYDVFVTADQNLQYQQNLKGLQDWGGRTRRPDEPAPGPAVACSQAA